MGHLGSRNRGDRGNGPGRWFWIGGLRFGLRRFVGREYMLFQSIK